MSGKLRFISVLLVAIYVLIASFACPAAAQGDMVTACLATRAVKIDGKWTGPNEWTDTFNVTFGETARLHAKHNEQFLYLLVDFISDTSPFAGDFCRIQLDPLHNHGTDLGPDDYAFAINWDEDDSFKIFMEKGTGSPTKAVEGFWGNSSFDASNDPYSSSPHRIYEFRIPKTILGSSRTLGLFVACRSGLSAPSMVWPSNSVPMKPNGWGHLEISDLPFPVSTIQTTATSARTETATPTFTQTLTTPSVTSEATTSSAPGATTTSARSSTSNPCIIATAAHESELAPEVQLLRNFRDNIVMSTSSGRSFMALFNRWYYSFSPSIAKAISENQLAREIVKISLYPLVAALRVSTEVHSILRPNGELATVLTGVAAAALLGVVYGFPSMALLSVTRQKKEHR